MRDGVKALYFSKEDGFHERERPPAVAGLEDDEDRGLTLWELGYEQGWSYGDADQVGDHVRSWRNTRNVSPRYVIELDDADFGQMVYVDDLPSLMTLRIQLATVMSCAATADDIRGMRKTVAKLFRLYHHHDAGTACDECNPSQTAAIERRRSEEEKSTTT